MCVYTLGLVCTLDGQEKSFSDTFSALMAVCASQHSTEDELVLCAKHLIASGAVMNACDRYELYL